MKKILLEGTNVELKGLAGTVPEDTKQGDIYCAGDGWWRVHSVDESSVHMEVVPFADYNIRGLSPAKKSFLTAFMQDLNKASDNQLGCLNPKWWLPEDEELGPNMSSLMVKLDELTSAWASITKAHQDHILDNARFNLKGDL